MENLKGVVTLIENDMSYGFVKVPKVGEVFFTTQTQFINTDFDSVTIGQKVKVVVVDTPRGPLATHLIQ